MVVGVGVTSVCLIGVPISLQSKLCFHGRRVFNYTREWRPVCDTVLVTLRLQEYCRREDAMLGEWPNSCLSFTVEERFVSN